MEKSDAIAVCHKEYRLRRMHAVGGFFHIMAASFIVILPTLALVLLCFLSGASWDTLFPVWILVNFVVFCNPFVVAPITSFAWHAITRPKAVRMTERGITIRTMFTSRELRWQDVHVQNVDPGKVELLAARKNKIVLRDDLDRFDEMRATMKQYMDQHRTRSQ